MASPRREPSAAQNEGSTPVQEHDGLEPTATSYKRRRSTRACDDCRRKKIKCDGKQPCSSCAEFNSACAFEGPSKRNKLPHPSDLEALKARLQLAESVIRKFLPHIDLQTLESVPSSPRHNLTRADTRDVSVSEQATPGSASESAKYMPLVDSQHQLRLTDSGDFDFHGLSSDAAFLSRITQHFPGLQRYDSRLPFLSQASHSNHSLPTAITSLPLHPMGHSNYDYSKLPPRELARMLCEYSFNHATCLLRIVHVPSFYKRFDDLYDTAKENYAQNEAQYLGLLYSVLALGSMYDVDENDPSNPDHYNEAMRRGYKFYQGARLYLRDLAECRDLTTLQALLFIIQFLQSIGNLNSCYNLIGIALRSALRMGLHRQIDDPRMTPIERETRKQVFHTTRQMDIYLSATLGLPVVLSKRDIDQPLPVVVDDNGVTANVSAQAQSETPAIIEAFNAHAKLMDILAMVVECMYPPQAAIRKATHVTCMIDCSQVREVEQRLDDWYQQLPDILRPGHNEDVQLNRVQILLRFAYAHVQMMLYRPFMQYLNHQGTPGDESNQRYQALATAGISVCRNVIKIGLEIRKQAVLIGPYWFITYTQFFAVLCLIFYVSHNPDESGFSDILSDAIMGKDAISGLNQRSLAADRLSVALESVFAHLPHGLSAQIQSVKNSMKFQSRRQDHAVGVVNAYGTNHVTSPVFSQHQQQWQLSSTTATAPGILSHMAVPLHNRAAQTPSCVAASSSHAVPDRLMFPLGNPIAYPSAMSGDISTSTLQSTCSDTMQLIVPDFFDNLNEHSTQPLHTAHVDQTAVSDLGLGAFQTFHPRFIDDPIARMFSDLETPKL